MFHSKPINIFENVFVCSSNKVRYLENAHKIDISTNNYKDLLLNLKNLMNKQDQIVIHNNDGMLALTFAFIAYMVLNIGDKANIIATIKSKYDEENIQRDIYNYSIQAIDRIWNDKPNYAIKLLEAEKDNKDIERPRKLDFKHTGIISFLVDVSGSTEPFIGKFVDKINDMITKYKDSNLKVYLSKFDNNYTKILVGEDIKDVKPLKYSEFRDFGMTAFYKSAHSQINLIDNYNKDKNLNVTFTMFTDGDDNESGDEYSSERLRNKLKEFKDKGWNFFYMGPNDHKYSDLCVGCIEFSSKTKNIDEKLNKIENMINNSSFRYSDGPYLTAVCKYFNIS